MSLSDYMEVTILNHFFRNTSTSSPATVYVALYTTDPTDANTGAEVSGSNYARTAVTFGAPGATSGIMTNSAAVTFPTASGSWGTITHFGICDASSAGNLYVSNALTSSIAVASGQRPVFDIAALSVTLA